MTVVNTKEWGVVTPRADHYLLQAAGTHTIPVMLFWFKKEPTLCVVSPGVALTGDRLRVYMGRMRQIADWCERRHTFILDDKRVEMHLREIDQFHNEPRERKYATFPRALAQLGYGDVKRGRWDGLRYDLPPPQLSQANA